MAAVQPENKIVIGALLVGKYRITRELGRGGMAAVYEAEHVDIGKKIAIKVLAAELASSAIVVERFIREARAAASVKSPHIVEVYDSGRLEDDRPFIAMELLEGESLYDRMARVRLIDPRTTVRIIGQVAKGLTKAHAVGIVHRDLKPENIHLCKSDDGEEIAKILDFGLAKFYSPVDADEKTARLTREGAVFGTPAYMSPEQVKGQGSVDHRSDLWALGCMTFECLTGRPVWNTDQGVAMTFASIATAPLPPPGKFRPDLPPAFETWFRKALERDANKRFQTAKELADELARALDAPPISLVNVGSPSQIELDVVAQLREVPSASPPLSLDSRAGPQTSPPPADGARDRAQASASPGYDSLYPNSVVRAPALGDVGGAPVDHGLASVAPGAPPIAPRSSEPIDLFALRTSALSATDLPPTAASEGPSLSGPERGRSALGRVLASALVLAGLGAAGWVAYPKLRAKIFAMKGSAATTSSAAVSASASARAAPPPPEQPKWMIAVEDGQQLIVNGDTEGALRKFKEAADSGGGALARSLMDQVKVGAGAAGPCRMAALSHPRLGYGGIAGRPTVAATSKGAVVAWTDDHEQPGHEHVYSVLVDPVGRPTSNPRDLTPEADYAVRPELLSVDDRVVLLFWDKGGRQPGVKARWIDGDGRIGGMSVEVAASKAGPYWPAIDRSPDGGGFWVAWQADTDREGDDIFLRRLDADLHPQGAEIRATDYEPSKGKTVKVDVPSIAISKTNLFVAYTLERDKQFFVERMRLPVGGPELQGPGLERGTAKGQHELGETLVVNDDKSGGDYSSMACDKDACFLVWHEIDKGGAQAALVDSSHGNLLWRKRFAPHGAHPAVAVGADGDAEVVYYEAGRVRMASISRDGVGAPTTFAKAAGELSRASIAAGQQRGEWLVSWLDLESGHTEPFLARLECRN